MHHLITELSTAIDSKLKHKQVQSTTLSGLHINLIILFIYIYIYIYL